MAKDIKVGETYNVRVKVIGIAKDGVDAIYVDADGIAGLHIGKRRVGILRSISPENVTKNTENSPKYDPNRKFRKGDKVRIITHKGRHYDEDSKIRHLSVFSVTEDEEPLGAVELLDTDFYFEVDPAYLELVTPVEEQEPYVVRLAKPDGVEEWHVEPRNNNLALVAVFGHRHPHAKDAAEAECVRLNAEYRKEHA